jgi:hypothetical protein
VPYKDPEKKKAADKAWAERNRERKAATTKAWAERNRERRAEISRAWNKRNPEQRREMNKSWRERNRDRALTTAKAWIERNRERKAATTKAWYERNRERKAATTKTWIKLNPELNQEKHRKRRANKRNSLVPFTANEKAKLLILERTRRTLQKETGRKYHLDHILPLVHGGIHHPINLRILEGVANMSKNDKLLPEAIDLAHEHYKLYYERIGPERAEEFVKQLAKAIGLNENEIDLKRGILPSLPKRATLEDLME